MYAEYDSDDEHVAECDVQSCADDASEMSNGCEEIVVPGVPVGCRLIHAIVRDWCDQETLCSRNYHQICTREICSMDSNDSCEPGSEEERKMRPQVIALELDGVINLVSDSDSSGIGLESGTCGADGDFVH